MTPFLFQFLKEMDTPKKPSTAHASAVGTHTRNHFRAASSPTQHRWRRTDERQPLVRHRSLGPIDEDELANAKPVAGGTVLGIHNLAIVMPQFIVSFLDKLIRDRSLMLFTQVAVVASAIFRIVDGPMDPSDNTAYLGKTGVAYVLRFGGLCTLVSTA